MNEAAMARYQSILVPALLVASMIGSVLAFSVSAASSNAGTTAETGCWDEYRADGLGVRGVTVTLTMDDRIQVVVPQGVNPAECTPGIGCFYGSDGDSTSPQRLYVPHGLSPDTTCGDWGPAKAVREPVNPTAFAAEQASDNPVPLSTVTTRAPQGLTAIATTAEPASSTRVAVSSTVSSTTTLPTYEPGSGFTESFDDDAGLDRFKTGVDHRDNILVKTTSWQGDHDRTCGPPSTTRTIDRSTPSDSIYLCNEHLMTSVGDTSGYSTAFFSPLQTFTTERSVSWEVNVTDLGDRQWWEVAILPLDADDVVAVEWLSPSPSGLARIPDSAVVVGSGPFGGDFRVTSQGQTVEPLGRPICEVDPDGCASKTIRRTFSVADNDDGTVSIDAFGQVFAVDGAFPDGAFKVVFADHNYTPDKSNNPVGYTWHWDTIAIQ